MNDADLLPQHPLHFHLSFSLFVSLSCVRFAELAETVGRGGPPAHCMYLSLSQCEPGRNSCRLAGGPDRRAKGEVCARE